MNSNKIIKNVSMNSKNYHNIISNSISEHLEVAKLLQDNKFIDNLNKIVQQIISVINNGNKILIAGNGGSASDAQHFAAELVVRYKNERNALPAIALSTDTSILTATANDYDFARIFSRQVEALAKEGDMFIGITTSGNSPNIVQAFKVAKFHNLQRVCLTGNKIDSPASEESDFIISIPSHVTARIQEMHILALHIICEILDEKFTF